MIHNLLIASIALPILGSVLAVKASTIKVRDNMDAFIADIARQGRWNLGASIMSALGTVLVAVVVLLQK